MSRRLPIVSGKDVVKALSRIGYGVTRQKTREFYKILVERGNEAKENPEILTPLEDLYEL